MHTTIGVGHAKLNRKSVYVVDLKTMPELPIMGVTESEKVWHKALNGFGGTQWPIPSQGLWARALTHAIETGVITEPGKYGIHLVPGTQNYEVYTIKED